ncbi:MAG: hypothetical protein Pars92KO_28250 [Parasphingorhabdus sp.]
MVDERNNGLKTIVAVILLLAFIGISTNSVNGQANVHAHSDVNTERQIVIDRAERFLSLVISGDNESLADEGLVSGELAEPAFQARELRSEIDKIIMISTSKAVARRTVPSGVSNDYFYLQKPKDQWQVYAIRSLALPGFIWEMKREMAGRSDLTPDLEATYQNILLTTLSDSELRSWFYDHKAELEEMRLLKPVYDRSMKELDVNAVFKSDQPRVNELVEKLHLNYAEQKDDMFVVSIGGILDNSVGFLHAAPEHVPEISTFHYIWIEPLGDGWYLYKTT